MFDIPRNKRNLVCFQPLDFRLLRVSKATMNVTSLSRKEHDYTLLFQSHYSVDIGFPLFKPKASPRRLAVYPSIE